MVSAQISLHASNNVYVRCHFHTHGALRCAKKILGRALQKFEAMGLLLISLSMTALPNNNRIATLIIGIDIAIAHFSHSARLAGKTTPSGADRLLPQVSYRCVSDRGN